MIDNPSEFVRALPAGYDGQFDWDFLKPALPGLIEPMDFDGNIERNGHILTFETKEPGAPLKVGQRITLETLAMKPYCTVVLCAKRPQDIRAWSVWWNEGGQLRAAHFDGSSSDLLEFVHLWFLHADGRRVRPWTNGQIPRKIPGWAVCSLSATVSVTFR